LALTGYVKNVQCEQHIPSRFTKHRWAKDRYAAAAISKFFSRTCDHCAARDVIRWFRRRIDHQGPLGLMLLVKEQLQLWAGGSNVVFRQFDGSFCVVVGEIGKH
jgi:hypothetical protein